MKTRSPLILACLSAVAPAFAMGAVVVGLAADAGTSASGPDWIKVAPRGAVTTRDGRAFDFNPEALAARFASDAIDLPIDVDHAIAKATGSTPAVGWIKQLEARADGLYARVEWLDSGKALLAARSHRYISPTFPHDEAGAATWLHSASLVAAPALSNMPALASADPATTEPAPMKTILTALGLAATATEAEGLAALATLQAKMDPAKFVAKDIHDTALAQLAAVTTKLQKIETATRQTEIDAVIEDALKAKKIVPAQKEHYVALCATDAGLVSVKAMLAATPANLVTSGLGNLKLGEGGGELTAQQLQICSAMGLSPAEYKKSLAVA